jgi:hypothetical protein
MRYVSIICAGYSETPCRMFLQMSYISLACGTKSRGAQFVVKQCVHLLYALRCAYLAHCLDVMPKYLVQGPEDLSLTFLNSNRQNAFAALQDIKRPGVSCIEHDDRQNVTWIGYRGDSLEVHSGSQGLDRIPVSHENLRTTFHALCGEIVDLLRQMQIPIITWRQFRDLRDSTSVKTPGEGMGTYNASLQIKVGQAFDREARFNWMMKVILGLGLDGF